MSLDLRTSLPDDLDDIAGQIPYAPRGLGVLRQLLALLPPPLGATLQPSFPADELTPPEQAVNTMAGDGPGTVSGATIMPGTVGTPQIASGAITMDAMRTGVRPIQIVDVLPVLPDPDYPPAGAGTEGSIVLLTTDGKLYRNVGDVWTAEVPAVDITGIEEAIRENAIEAVGALPALPDVNYPPNRVVFLTTDGKLYRNFADVWTAAVPGADVTGTVANATNAVTAALALVANLATISVGVEAVAVLPTLPDSDYPQASLVLLTTTGKLYRNTTGSAWSVAVDGGDITALTITAASIAANTITAAKIAANTITTNEIAALTIVAGNIAASTITGAKIAANTIAAANIVAGTITATEIAAATITGDRLVAGTITASQIAAATITGAKIAALTIEAGNIAANTITGNKIAANTITAGEIAAAAIGTSELVVGAVLTGGVVNDDGAGGALGTVIINSSGIQILNGALVLEDEFGSTQMTASGFSGSWSDFVKLGLYNGSFRAGIAGVAANGRTSALPYWTVADNVGTTGVITFLDPGVKFTWGAASDRVEIASDLVPCLPGETLEGKIAATITAAVASAVGFTCHIRRYDEAQVFISEVAFSLASGGVSSVAFDTYRSVYLVPEGTYFVKLVIEAFETSHDAGNKFEVWHAGLTSSPMSLGEIHARGELRIITTDGSGGPGLLAWSNPNNSTLNGIVLDVNNAVTVLSVTDGSGGGIIAVDFLDAFLRGFSGTSFPASPTTNDRFYRTDYKEWFAYDGTRWRCVNEHHFTADTSVVAGGLSSNFDIGFFPLLAGGSPDIWLIDFRWFYRVSTTHSGTQFWQVDLRNLPTDTVIATLTSDKATVATWLNPAATSIGAAVGSQKGLYFHVIKTSTPGVLIAGVELGWAHIAT